MKFGKIDYLNLLPFSVFAHSFPANSSFKLSLECRRSYPSKLNKLFLMRQIEAGFISSFAAINQKVTSVGICSNGAVWSVIAIHNKKGEDYQSATSNALCKILKLDGEVLIGDRALRFYLKDSSKCVDLGAKWKQNTKLPFVFGRLCFNQKKEFYQRLAHKFSKKRVKIPHYILMRYSTQTNVLPKDIQAYLKHIYYKIDTKTSYGLKRFYRSARLLNLKPPKRFS